MTSIVNFEERMKSTNTLTNEFFSAFNRMHDAKLSGALKEDELSNLLILENKFFANLVSKGLKTEEDVETYENDMATGKMPIGTYPHKGLDLAFSSIKQTDTAALFDAETINKRTQMPESYSKGLRKVS